MSVPKNSLSDYELYKLASKTNLEELLLFGKAVKMLNTKEYNKLYKRAKKLDILDKSLQPLIKGSDLVKLGLKPSPKFSTILNDAYNAQISTKFKNYDEAFAWLENYLKTFFYLDNKIV